MTNISHFAFIIQVKDSEETAKYYEDILGFKVTFKWGDPVDYVVMNRDITLL